MVKGKGKYYALVLNRHYVLCQCGPGAMLAHRDCETFVDPVDGRYYPKGTICMRQPDGFELRSSTGLQYPAAPAFRFWEYCIRPPHRS